MSPSGAVGRRDVEYVFDSAMVLAGSLRTRTTAACCPTRTCPSGCADYIVNRLSQRIGLDGTSRTRPRIGASRTAAT